MQRFRKCRSGVGRVAEKRKGIQACVSFDHACHRARARGEQLKRSSGRNMEMVPISSMHPMTWSRQATTGTNGRARNTCSKPQWFPASVQMVHLLLRIPRAYPAQSRSRSDSIFSSISKTNHGDQQVAAIPEPHSSDARHSTRYRAAIEPIAPSFAAPPASSEIAPLALANSSVCS